MNKTMEKKKLSILGISIWKLFVYFIIYSFLGYIIETLFGIATKGVWECRQSFLYGPFLRNIWSRSSMHNTICKVF
ncbi:MAG: hypothetical protein HFJ40_02760 [Clostridia bacterium]|nr:hypothetical protein [Clostridia bacterium]